MAITKNVLLAGGLACTTWTNPAYAEDAATANSQAAWDAAFKVGVSGPADIALRDEAKLHLPSGMVFIPLKEASALMQAWGNGVDSQFIGLVTSREENSNWVVTVDFNDEGFVADDEAKDWNADDMLQSIKDGTEEQNKERADQGIPALDVTGWIEKPGYDTSTHRLVWSMNAVERGAAVGTPSVVNYNTYALGREGYFKLDLLTDSQHVSTDKNAAKKLIGSLEYNSGKTYTDYKSSTDKLAAYGIAALVGGVAAKKLGLIALAAAFGAKFIKLIAVGAVVAGSAIVKLFRGKRSGGEA
jgi:uncharacterized membrane-anchored protein